MKRILFVDDEPHVLQGLRRTLRGMRKEWSMRFANSGREALEELEREVADIVISDMKMPGMDGATLLMKVKELYPDTIRIVLSGQCDDEALVRTMGCMHQFLSKPCDSKTLKAVVARACRLREQLGSPRLAELAHRLESIPSLPTIYLEITEKLRDPNVSLESIGEVIEGDIGLSTKVLKIVNSAYFALPNPIHSVPRAAVFLGLQLVKAVVLGAHIFDGLDASGGLQLDAGQLMNRATCAANLAKRVARDAGLSPEASDEAFLASMLHDVGILILASNLPEECARAAALEAEGMDSEAACSQIFGATSSEVGAYVLGLWGLPDTILEAIAFCRRPSELPEHDLSVLDCVHIACALASESVPASGRPSLPLDTAFVQRTGLDAMLGEWRASLEVEDEGDAEGDAAAER